MPTSRVANKKVVPGSWRTSRNRLSLLTQMAKQAEELASQAERLRDLKRQARGVTFKNIADATGATERQAQRWFAGDSDIGPENLKALARFLGTTPDYIEYGTVARKRGPTPNVVNDLSADHLDRLEAKLDEILDQLAALMIFQGVARDEQQERKRAATTRRKRAA